MHRGFVFNLEMTFNWKPMTKRSTFEFFINTYLGEVVSAASVEIASFEESDFEEVEVPELCLQNVLGFARAYRTIETVQAGKTELLLN